MDIVRAISHALLDFFHQHQLSGLFVFVFIEEAGVPIPIPGDTLILLVGTQARALGLGGVWVVLVSALAAVAGSSVLYWIMRLGGRGALLRYGKYIHLNEERVAKLEGQFQRRGRIALIIGRMIPGLRIVTTAVAGLANVPYREYVPIAGIAGIIWATFYYVLGVVIGREGSVLVGLGADLIELIPKWLLAILIIAASIAAWGGTNRFLRRRRTRGRERAAKQRHEQAQQAKQTKQREQPGPVRSA